MSDGLRIPMPQISRTITYTNIKEATYTLSQWALQEMAVEYIKRSNLYIDMDGEWSFNWCDEYETDRVYLEVSCARREQREADDANS